MFFVFKQKTAYEMRISDWSSDVCSSDLAQDIALIRTPTGFAFAPIADGAVMEPKAFNALPQEERQRIEGEIEKLQGELQDVVKLIPGWATEHRDALRELRSEEQTSELQSLMRISYAVFCLQKKQHNNTHVT